MGDNHTKQIGIKKDSREEGKWNLIKLLCMMLSIGRGKQFCEANGIRFPNTFSKSFSINWLNILFFSQFNRYAAGN